MTTLIATAASLASATVSGLVFGITDTALLFGIGVFATAIFLATWEFAESLRLTRK
jgi:hypothetical protein